MSNHQPDTAMTFAKTRTTGLALAATTTLLFSCHPPEKPVTQQEAYAFGKKIEASVAQHNPNVLDNVIDEKYFAALVLREAHQSFNFGFAKEAKSAIDNLHLGQEVIARTRQIGSFQLLRQYEKEGHQHLLFRYFTDDADINYNDFTLVKGDQGVRADDLYVYANGQQLSKTVTETLLDAGKKSDMSEEEKENARLIRNAEDFLKGANPEEAYSYYDQLPDKKKKEPAQEKLHIRIAQKLGDSAFKAAVDEYKLDFPNDPYIYLTILRTGERHVNYAEALDALNRFETFLPYDPFLDFYRGVIYQRLDKPAESTLAFERFRTRWPTFGPAIAELAHNQMQAGHPDSVALLIREAQRLNAVTPDQVEAVKKAYPAIRPYLK